MADDRDWSGFAADNARKRTRAADDPDDAEDQRGQLRRPPDGHVLLVPSRRRLAADGPRFRRSVRAAAAARPERDRRPESARRRCRTTCSTSTCRRLVARRERPRSPASLPTAPTSDMAPSRRTSAQTEIYSTAMPLRRSVVIRTSNGSNTMTFDGTQRVARGAAAPVDVLTLAGQELTGAKIDAMLFFPAR